MSERWLKRKAHRKGKQIRTSIYETVKEAGVSFEGDDCPECCMMVHDYGKARPRPDHIFFEDRKAKKKT